MTMSMGKCLIGDEYTLVPNTSLVRGALQMLACTYAVVEESAGLLGLVCIDLLFAARRCKNTDNLGTRQWEMEDCAVICEL